MRNLFLASCLMPAALAAQQPVTIQVDAAAVSGNFNSSWTYFGYDEANYTYADNGQSSYEN